MKRSLSYPPEERSLSVIVRLTVKKSDLSGIEREIYLETRTSLWEFAEIWVDPWLSPPYILMLIKEQSGKFSIQNPAQNYKAIFSSDTYEESKMWLLEDEYERVSDRFDRPE